MQFGYSDLGHLLQGAVVEVTLSSRAFVRVMDPSNFSAYQRGGRYTFYGGEAVRSPVPIAVPHTGYWTVVVDLNGAVGSVNWSARVLTPA
jgi:Domain of unknown function (DUF1883)